MLIKGCQYQVSTAKKSQVGIVECDYASTVEGLRSQLTSTFGFDFVCDSLTYVDNKQPKDITTGYHWHARVSIQSLPLFSGTSTRPRSSPPPPISSGFTWKYLPWMIWLACGAHQTPFAIEKSDTRMSEGERERHGKFEFVWLVEHGDAQWEAEGKNGVSMLR